MPVSTNLAYIRNVMLSAVRDAGEMMLSPETFGVEQKGDHDFVTECDKRVQARLHELLSAAVPEAGFVSEEMDNAEMYRSMGGKCFVVDPIDGTHNFMNGIPISAVSIAYVENGIPLVGVVYNPFSGEAFNAVYGEARASISYKQHGIEMSRDIRPSGIEMEHALLLVEDGWHADKEQARKWMLGTRAIGSAALNICFVAAGRGHSYISMPLHVWDYAAGALIARESGLSVCSGDGKPLPHLVEGAQLVVGRPEDIATLVEIRRACEESYRGDLRFQPTDSPR